MGYDTQTDHGKNSKIFYRKKICLNLYISMNEFKKNCNMKSLQVLQIHVAQNKIGVGKCIFILQYMLLVCRHTSLYKNVLLLIIM
jgi:hypothetical protein